ncbi:hypothetical protein [Caballeronia sordidicola]|uniref:hypothetical protein n=1 Tax=Caballeronia sordidicola TaxID=196367 RepID=UPI0004CFF3BC|nr:hypothetical protein [Caballeronia sordidicola]
MARKLHDRLSFSGRPLPVDDRLHTTFRNEQLPGPSKHSAMWLDPVFLSEPDSQHHGLLGHFPALQKGVVL